ncbi:MAG: hypothetical protein K2J67_02035 [Lachnospiraceae bacterium]|nr:hypothetical protein [Lachnospiraceae bacterium]
MMLFVDDCPTTDRLAELREDYMHYSELKENGRNWDIRDRASRRCFLDLLEIWFLTQDCYPLADS